MEIDERRKTIRRGEKLLEWRLSLLLFVSGLDKYLLNPVRIDTF